jgi:hypothetical protein
MTDNNTVQVQEVKPASVSTGRAWRIIAGKFIVDFVETFSVALPVSAVFLPTSMADLNKLWIALSIPLGSAFVSAGRRNWPLIKNIISPPEGA